MNRIKQILEEKRTELDGLDAKRAKLVYFIETLEVELRKQPSLTRKRERSVSVPKLTRHILLTHTNGLTVPSLLTELKKLGYETTSANPINNLNSILHRHEDFKRLEDGRWLLIETVASSSPEGFANTRAKGTLLTNELLSRHRITTTTDTKDTRKETA
ncbi:MAG: hypothetical protein ACREQR_13855 [Candidatus Binataceae bacterium]